MKSPLSEKRELGSSEEPSEELSSNLFQDITGHLNELRNVLVRSVTVLMAAFFVCFYHAEKLVGFLKKPILQALPENQKMLYFFGLTEQFYTYMKVAFMGALAVSTPFLLYQVWLFISPALNKKEKKLVLPFLGFASGAFLGGLVIAYRWVLPYTFSFLLKFGAADEVPLLSLSDYTTLSIQLLLGVALIFEIPVILGLFGTLGLVNATLLRTIRPYAYVALSVFAAVATPTPDALSMILVLIPLYFLYELGILIVSFVGKRELRRDNVISFQKERR